MSSLNYMELCRLCLVKDRVQIPIFEGEGDIRQIFLKIAACLPVKVKKDDKLPKKICDECMYKVESLYQFWNTTANAEKQLLEWLGEAVEDKKTSSDAQHVKQEGLEQDPCSELAKSLSRVEAVLAEAREAESDNDHFATGKAETDSDDEPLSSLEPTTFVNVGLDGSGTSESRTQGEFLAPGAPSTSKTSNSTNAQTTTSGGRSAAEGTSASEEAFPSKSSNVLNIQIINHSSANDRAESDKESYTVTEFIIPAGGKKNGRSKSKKTHKCEYCSKTFMWKSVLAEHRRTHTKEKPHKCGICGVGFGSYAGLYKHRVVHVSDKPFECQVCRKAFKRSIQLKYHMEVHTGTETLKCDSCDYSTTSKRYMQLHKDTHKSKLKYVCEICNKGFNAKSYLIEHFNKHSGLRPFLCDVCGKSYPAKTSLSIHYQMKHDPSYKPVDKTKCNTCGKMVLNRTQDIARHAQTHKKEECHICGQHLGKGETLKAHLRLHCEKRFFCDVCKISFKTKVHLDTHNKIHEEKPQSQTVFQEQQLPQIETPVVSTVDDRLDVLHQVVIAPNEYDQFTNGQEIIYFNIKNDTTLNEVNNIQTFIFAP